LVLAYSTTASHRARNRRHGIEYEHEHEKQPEQTHASKWPVGRAQF